jgi:hypothetical protein
MKESRKEFIKDLHSRSDIGWQKKIEREFPKVFKKDDLVAGKWYNWNGINPAMGFLSKKPSQHSGCYQFDYLINGETKSYDSLNITYLSLATDEEVEQALIKEAKERGFKKGVTVVCKDYDNAVFDGEFRFGENKRNALDGLGTGYIFEDGFWATIIEKTITKEQAEKELGKIIEG